MARAGAKVAEVKRREARSCVMAMRKDLGAGDTLPASEVSGTCGVEDKGSKHQFAQSCAAGNVQDVVTPLDAFHLTLWSWGNVYRDKLCVLACL
jgi:hypothetical protein